MDLSLYLLAGHMLGDWVVQTDWQAAHKTTSWRANQAHVYTYHLTLFTALLYPLWGRFPTVRLLIAYGLSWGLHSLIDRRWPVRWLLRVTQSPAFAETTLGVLAADQTLHVATLAVMGEESHPVIPPRLIRCIPEHTTDEVEGWWERWQSLHPFYQALTI